MTDYFVSAAGNDSNDGSYGSPWATLAKVNTELNTEKLRGLRDRILFRRGDTFYGNLVMVNGLQFSTNPGRIRFGAYGDNAVPPIISGYKLLNTSGGWTSHDANTWKLNYSQANVNVTYTGNAAAVEYDSNAGFLKVDGVIKGVKKSSLGALANQWDFYSSGTTLYVRSTARPTTLASDIRLAINMNGIILKSRCTVSDLIVEGFGNIGIGAVGSEAITVRGCTVREIGGSYIDETSDLRRVGNAFQVFYDCSNMLFEYNTAADIYDAAWTIQGGSPGSTRFFRNITWRRNYAYRCAQAEEYWFDGGGDGFVNCVSEYNTYLFSGYGWGSDVRPDQNQRVGQQSYSWGTIGAGYVGDVDIRRNVYYDCYGSFAYNAYTPTGQTSDYNVILLRPSTKIQYQAAQTIENAAAWVAAVGREQKSQFITLPASADVAISNADVTAALATLNSRVRVGQVMAIHGPWT
jgi:hypothetical protein